MCWLPQYAILIFLSTSIDYIAGIKIAASTGKSRKIYLILSIVSNLGILFTFKYLSFFLDTVGQISTFLNQKPDWLTLHILLPVGISFYTFQSLSYTIDVYRGVKSPERHFGIFALYVSFFPQLVAGPIEKSTSLLPQLTRKRQVEYQTIADGLKLMAWGFFKKLVIADRLAIYVDLVFSNPGDYEGLPLIIGSIFFHYQIYCDFSGYSDIAVGAAQTMGIKLNRNFVRPFLAKSMSEKWKRWHISLGEWFKDYLYIPLKGRAFLQNKRSFLIIITWLLIGLWHGANWTFIAWGLIHGSYLIISHKTKGFRKKVVTTLKLEKVKSLHNAVRIITTFFLGVFAIIFFRSSSIENAFVLLRNAFSNLTLSYNSLLLPGFGKYDLVIALCAIAGMELVHILQEHISKSSGIGLRSVLSHKPLPLKFSVYVILIFVIINFGVFSSNEYIYFQF
jgi:alginate O-acetyltransferase complex protein AlgI